MPGAVPFTSTIALANSTYPYIKKIADLGYLEAFKSDSALIKGLNIYKGTITHKGVAKTFNKNYLNPAEAIS